MGNKKSRAFIKGNIGKNNPCVSNIFDVAINFKNNIFELRIITDLPLKTKIGISAERLFRTTDSEWLMTLIEKEFPVVKLENQNRGVCFSAKMEELDKKGLYSYRYLKGSMGIQIIEIPNDKIDIEISAPAYSQQHKFGICNRQLTGKHVSVNKSGHSIDYNTSISVPFTKDLIKDLCIQDNF